MKKYLKQLHWQIFISMIIGLIIGSFIDTNSTIYSISITLGVIFIKLLKMITIPLIFTSILTGITSITDFNQLGRIGFKTISYYMLTSLFAIIIGLGLTNILKPGNSYAHSETTKVYDYSNLNTPDSTLDIFVRMIPTNPIAAATEGDMLSIIFFTILLGVAITKLPKGHKEPLTSFFESLFQAIMNLTQMIIKLSPIGVFGLIVKTVSTSNLALFYSIGKYMITIAIGLSIHVFIVLPMLFFILTRINPLKHFRAMSSAMATAFSTSSSSSTLPVTIKCVNENVKASKEVSGFVLPMGATINMDGTALYECAGVIFISQILGVELSITQQLVVVITALLASIGAAGIPSAGLVMIFIVTQAVGFRNEDVALIIGAMLAVDRPLDMFRTMVNVTSDSIGTAIIAHSEGDKLY
ncbi:dicarboxylate/amino acid:cation symporter [Candidatus Marinimicrobia bacterium]|nr:dicarboxylate/amino acid:cation symporter [Candidatus Neomarinimicrobiota bacterium]